MYEERIAAGSPPVMTPSIEPVSVEEQAAFSHFTAPDSMTGSPPSPNPDYLLVESFISAAREHIERDIAYAMMTQSWRLSLDRFPGVPVDLAQAGQLFSGDPYYPFLEARYLQVDPNNFSIDLLRPPVQSVESIKYIDCSGDEQTFDADNYLLFANKISLKPGKCWPVTATIPDAVRIEYTTGFGDDPSDVSERLKTAVKFLAGWWYDQRIPVGSTPSVPVELTLRAILSGFRRFFIPR